MEAINNDDVDVASSTATRFGRNGGSGRSGSVGSDEKKRGVVVVSINGRLVRSTAEATISIFDTSFHRGDGVFEVMAVHTTRRKTAAGVGATAAAGAQALPPSQQIRSLDCHLKRLQTSAESVGCPLPNVQVLRRWLEEAAAAIAEAADDDDDDDDDGDGGTRRPPAGALRLIATKGGDGAVSPSPVPPSVVISWMSLPTWPSTFTLLPTVAPWHPAGLPGWETPIKWTSYGPNVVATNRAKRAGFSDALLLSPHRVVFHRPADTDTDTITGDSGSSGGYFNGWEDIPLRNYHVLDGPNFALAWIQERTAADYGGDGDDGNSGCGGGGGVVVAAVANTTPILHIPCNKTLGLLPSITQAKVAELAHARLGWEVRRGVYTLGDLLDTADEVIVMSTTRGVRGVTKIGDHDIIVSSSVTEVGRGEAMPAPRARQLAKLLHDAT